MDGVDVRMANSTTVEVCTCVYERERARARARARVYLLQGGTQVDVVDVRMGLMCAWG